MTDDDPTQASGLVLRGTWEVDDREYTATDDLRTRAREAAEEAYRKPLWHVGTITDRLIEAFYEGYLAHAAQQPTRDIDVGELARVADAVFHEWWNDPDEPRFGPLYARAVLALLTGEEIS